MRFRLHIPNFFNSTIETGQHRAQPELGGRDVVVENVWKLPPHTVALAGRPAVSTSFELVLPRIPLGFTTFPGKHIKLEQDYGGHLYLLATDVDASRVTLVEAGPSNANGTGALVPFRYPEAQFVERGLDDFSPVTIAPPHGLAPETFSALVRATARAYDGNQRYVAIEIPFLRVGRDSNSYAIGVLSACGVVLRRIPRPTNESRFEWVGYPGAEDPVHRANFGVFLGAPAPLPGGAASVAYHDADGSVRLVIVGGRPGLTAAMPNGEELALDHEGRVALSPHDARRRGLAVEAADPPAQIRMRRRFPPDPAPAGDEITICVDGRPVPLRPGDTYAGTIVERSDALGIVIMRTAAGAAVSLALVELGAELRDPRRVDRELRLGNELEIGLHADRRPKLVVRSEGTATVQRA